MPNANDKRIALNTIYLYGRMLLTIFVSLYTSRVVLDVLGVRDYGIYNVVGGIVLILSFLNGTMSGATSRFISYELGAGNFDRLRKTFSAALTVHAGIALLVIVLGETVGLWYVNHELVIEPSRMATANVVYQFSLLSCVFTIFQIPYVAAIMAHEEMGYYAWVAIVNVLLKLGAILIVVWVAAADSLNTYALMMFVGTVIVTAMYFIYSRVKFAECRWTLRNDRTIVEGLLKFCTGDIFGTLCFTSRAQGVLVILNRFGGTVLNAAGGLASTVGTTLSSFAGSIITAFRPQIIQQYAKGEYAYMLTLLNNCARYCLLLLGLLIIPLLIGMDKLLDLWLVEPPRYTAVFCRLALVAVCGELLNTILGIGIHATGRIVRYSTISGAMYLAELPMMWLLLRWTQNPPVVYCVHLAMVFVITFVVSLILKYQLNAFNISIFWRRGVLTPMAILTATFVVTSLVTRLVIEDVYAGLFPTAEMSFISLVGMAIVSAVILLALSLCFALDASSRRKVLTKLHLKRAE